MRSGLTQAMFVMVLAGALATAGSAATPDPRGMVLQAGDVSSFTLTTTASVPLAKAGKGKPPGWRQRLVQWGYRTAFVADFREQRTGRQLSSQAVVLGTESGARAYLAAILRSPPAPPGLRRVVLPGRIGDESRLYVQYTSEGGTRYELQYLAWRIKNVFAGLALIQPRTKLSSSQISSLARTQNRRIERALAP